MELPILQLHGVEELLNRGGPGSFISSSHGSGAVCVPPDCAGDAHAAQHGRVVFLAKTAAWGARWWATLIDTRSSIMIAASVDRVMASRPAVQARSSQRAAAKPAFAARSSKGFVSVFVPAVAAKRTVQGVRCSAVPVKAAAVAELAKHFNKAGSVQVEAGKGDLPKARTRDCVPFPLFAGSLLAFLEEPLSSAKLTFP